MFPFVFFFSHTRKETTNTTKENGEKNTKENMQSVTTSKKVEKSGEAESFKHMKIKYLTLEDGHVGRNI
jgi:hypothetical protein